jgi:hypothetical protein
VPSITASETGMVASLRAYARMSPAQNAGPPYLLSAARGVG